MFSIHGRKNPLYHHTMNDGTTYCHKKDTQDRNYFYFPITR